MDARDPPLSAMDPPPSAKDLDFSCVILSLDFSFVILCDSSCKRRRRDLCC
jgi:hypothetical protein